MPHAAPELLLHHHDFVVALARQLLSNPAAADDVAQSTYLAALTRPPRDAAAARTWLGRVAHNFARQWRRSESRRARHEDAAAARHDDAPSAADVAEREAARRRVVEAVLALDEPYRATVLQRFYEALPPREIARRQDVPVETVRTRTKRGLERLRASLDAEFGDRARWTFALIPIAATARVPGVPNAARPAVVGAGAGMKIAAVAAALLGVIGLGWIVFRGSESQSVTEASAIARAVPVDAQAPAAPSVALAAAPGEALSSAGGAHDAREVVRAPVAVGPNAAAADVQSPSPKTPRRDGEIRGRLIDDRSAPVAGSWVSAERRDVVTGRSGQALTDEAGGFTIGKLLEGSYRVTAMDNNQTYPIPCAWLDGVRPGPDPIVIRIEDARRPSAVVTGSVVDEDGRPVTGAVDLGLWHDELRTGGGGELDPVTARFRIGPLPPGSFHLRANSDWPIGTTGAVVPVRVAAGQTLDLGAVVLHARGHVRVRVRRDDGTFVERFVMNVVYPPTHGEGECDFLQGANSMTISGLGAGTHELQVFGEGFLPATASVEAIPGRETPFDIEVRRGGAPYRIRVVDPSGADHGIRRRRLSIRDARGRALVDAEFRSGMDDSRSITLSLAPGEYRAEAATDAGYRAEARFTAVDGATSTETIELRLQ